MEKGFSMKKVLLGRLRFHDKGLTGVLDKNWKKFNQGALDSMKKVLLGCPVFPSKRSYWDVFRSMKILFPGKEDIRGTTFSMKKVLVGRRRFHKKVLLGRLTYHEKGFSRRLFLRTNLQPPGGKLALEWLVISPRPLAWCDLMEWKSCCRCRRRRFRCRRPGFFLRVKITVKRKKSEILVECPVWLPFFPWKRSYWGVLDSIDPVFPLKRFYWGVLDSMTKVLLGRLR